MNLINIIKRGPLLMTSNEMLLNMFSSNLNEFRFGFCNFLIESNL